MFMVPLKNISTFPESILNWYRYLLNSISGLVSALGTRWTPFIETQVVFVGNNVVRGC